MFYRVLWLLVVVVMKPSAGYPHGIGEPDDDASEPDSAVFQSPVLWSRLRQASSISHGSHWLCLQLA